MPARQWYTTAPVLGGGKRIRSLEERRLRGEIPGPDVIPRPEGMIAFQDYEFPPEPPVRREAPRGLAPGETVEFGKNVLEYGREFLGSLARPAVTVARNVPRAVRGEPMEYPEGMTPEEAQNPFLAPMFPWIGAPVRALTAAIKPSLAYGRTVTRAYAAPTLGKLATGEAGGVGRRVPKKPPVAPAPKVAAPAAKQPWEMTRAEFNLNPDNPFLLQKDELFRNNVHKVRIIAALKEGKPVPPEVLADYPDLAAQVKPVVAPEAAPGLRPAAPLSGSYEATRLARKAEASELRELGVLSGYGKREQAEWLGANTRYAVPVPPTGRIRLYRATPTGETISPGDYVTTSRLYAQQHIKNNLGGKGKISSLEATLDDIVPADAPNEFWYAPSRAAPPAEVTAKRAAESVTVKTRLQELDGAISAGEMRLRTKRNAIGEKLSEGELRAVQESLESAKTEKATLEALPSRNMPVPPQVAPQPAQAPLPPPAAATAGAGGPPVPPSGGGIAPGTSSPDDVLKRFTDFIHSPESANLAELTTQMRSRQLGQRAARFQERLSDLLSKGMKYEKALKQAQTEEMAGKLDRPLTTLSESLAEEVRDAAFAKVYAVLKDEPFEQMATAEALSNALQGKGIPRITGVKGGSAYTRLSRVFPPEVIQTLEKGKPLTESIENLLMAKGPRPPTRIAYPEPQLAGEQLGLGSRETPIKLTPDLRTPLQRQVDLESFKTRLANPPTPPDIADALANPNVQDALQGSLMPAQTQHVVIRALKEAGFTLMDIGNLLRANKSSFDQSFGRQTGLLIPRHPVAFAKAYTKAWAATFSERAADSSINAIHRDPLFALYDQLGLDFLRELKPLKGQVLKGAEEFGFFAGGERPIQKFTAGIPWVKFSNRGFVTGTNEMSWDLFGQHYRNMLKLNEQYASGALKLGTGKAFSVEKQMRDYGHMLEDMTARGRLGPLRELAPALNAFFWSTRLNMGRILTPRYLFHPNPIVRKEAWKIIGAFTASVAGVEALGEQLGLWEIGKQGHTLGKIRLGNTWFDPWVGFQQYARYANEMRTGTITSAQTGRIYGVDRIELTGKFLLSKAAPLVGLARLATTGKTYAGEEVDPSDPNQWFNELASLAVVDVMEAFQESGLIVGAISIPLVISGMSTVSAVGLTDVRNKVAGEMFPTGRQGKIPKYEDLSPKEQDRVNKSPRVQKELDELRQRKPPSGDLLNVSFQNYEAANEEIEAELSAAVKAHGGLDYKPSPVLKDFIQKAKERRWQTAQTTFSRDVEAALKRGKPEVLKDILREQYWAADAPQDMLTGELDFKARDKTRVDVLQRAKEAGIAERFILEKVSPWKDPAVAKAAADLEAAQETLRPYWELGDEIADLVQKKYPHLDMAQELKDFDIVSANPNYVNSQGQRYGDIAASMRREPHMQDWARTVKFYKEEMRRTDKAIDEAGMKWYGLTPLKEKE